MEEISVIAAFKISLNKRHDKQMHFGANGTSILKPNHFERPC
jgi:hypothetical protein